MTGLSILQTLTDTTIDSAKGYERAAELADSPRLKQTLSQAAAGRRKLVTELNAEIVRLGGEPREGGSTAGALHRVWSDITAAFEKGDEAAAERVEEGEDYIEKKFREALDSGELDAGTRAVVQRAHAEIAEGERLGDRLAEQYD
ncbi:MAG: PA2169 family four-helix-bundle protein [Sphingomonadaceae bacterium]